MRASEGAVVGGQQIADRDPVEVGQLRQPGHGHGAVTALVRADDDGLPSAAGLALDAVQGQVLLQTDGAQAGTECLAVARADRGLILGRSASHPCPVVQARRGGCSQCDRAPPRANDRNKLPE